MARHDRYESPISATLKGLAAGLVGTLVMTTALQFVDRIGRLNDGPPGDAPAVDPITQPDDLTGDEVSPTERVAERLASGVFHAEISTQTRQRLGLGIYWTYGAFWGVLSAQLQESLRPPTLLYGAILGMVVWLVGPGRLVPALGLYERQSPASIIGRVLAVSLHVLYGWTTAFTYRELAGHRRSDGTV
jgi:hypothetical protein